MKETKMSEKYATYFISDMINKLIM